MTTIRVDDSPRRIRVRLGTATIADTTEAKLVYREGEHPEYYLPAADLDWTSLGENPTQSGASPLGSHHAVTAPDGQVIGQRFTDGAGQGLVLLSRERTDVWLEEDEVAKGHPHDPYRRVDVLRSSRHIEVRANGKALASSTRASLVTETGLPARWYIPTPDVDWTSLTSSATTSSCQYKGTAIWWSLTSASQPELVDIAWAYDRPVIEAPKLAGLVSFFAEHDAIEVRVDGVVPAIPAFTKAWLNPSLHLANQQV